MLTGIEGKGWQRRWDQGRGLRHVMSWAPGMFFLILFCFILLILIDYEDTTSNCCRWLPQPPTCPTRHNKGSTMVYCCWAFLSTHNSPPFVDSNLDYLISKMPSRGSLLWAVIVLHALVDNKATTGKAELKKGEKEWRKNIVGDKQGMFLFLFLFFNYTN